MLVSSFCIDGSVLTVIVFNFQLLHYKRYKIGGDRHNFTEIHDLIIDMKQQQVPAPRLVSNWTVRCLSNVEAFSLRATDLEEVTSMFSRFLSNPRVQGAIR